jgi:Fic/DOC family
MVVLDPQVQTSYAKSDSEDLCLQSALLSWSLDHLSPSLNIDMAAHTIRLSRLFTPEYVKRINAQIVHPAPSVVVKPNELESTLGRPLHLSCYEPDKPASYLAATLAFGIIKGHPFMDGNKRTGMLRPHSQMMVLTPIFQPSSLQMSTSALWVSLA